MYARNNGEGMFGLDIEDGEVKEAKTLGVYDHLASKKWAIKLATDAVLTVLRID